MKTMICVYNGSAAGYKTRKFGSYFRLLNPMSYFLVIFSDFP